MLVKCPCDRLWPRFPPGNLRKEQTCHCSDRAQDALCINGRSTSTGGGTHKAQVRPSARTSTQARAASRLTNNEPVSSTHSATHQSQVGTIETTGAQPTPFRGWEKSRRGIPLVRPWGDPYLASLRNLCAAPLFEHSIKQRLRGWKANFVCHGTIWTAFE